MRRAPALAFVLVFVLSLFGVTSPSRPTPSSRVNGRCPRPCRAVGSPTRVITADAPRPSSLDASLLSARGVRQVVVQLSEESVSEVAATGATAPAQRKALGEVTAQQDRFIGSSDGTVIARTEIAVNTVVLEVDASQLAELAVEPGGRLDLPGRRLHERPRGDRPVHRRHRRPRRSGLRWHRRDGRRPR